MTLDALSTLATCIIAVMLSLLAGTEFVRRG